MTRFIAACAVLCLCASAEASAPGKLTTAAAVTTIAVNVITIDRTAKGAWKALKVAKKATVHVAKKVAGK